MLDRTESTLVIAGGSENAPRRHDVDSGVPARGSHHEAISTQTAGRSIRRLLPSRARLHRPGIHEQGFSARLPAKRRGQVPPVRGPSIHRRASRLRNGVPRV